MPSEGITALQEELSLLKGDVNTLRAQAEAAETKAVKATKLAKRIVGRAERREDTWNSHATLLVQTISTANMILASQTTGAVILPIPDKPKAINYRDAPPSPGLAGLD